MAGMRTKGLLKGGTARLLTYPYTDESKNILEAIINFGEYL